MRLVTYDGGRMTPLQMSGTHMYSEAEVHALLAAQLAAERGLSLDFSGEYVPVSLREELPLVARLLVAYHNSLITTNIQVRGI